MPEDHLTDDTDIDSDSSNDVIERVRSSYGAAAQDNAAKAKHAEEQQRDLQSRVHRQAGKLAATITKGVLWFLALVVIAVLVLSLPVSPWPVRRLALPLLLALNTFSLLFGFYVFKHRISLQNRLAAWIRHWLTGASQQ